MTNRKTIQGRDLLNNTRIYQDVAKGTKDMLACTKISNECNARFGWDDLNHGMMTSAIMDSSVGGCANAKKRKCKNTPSDRWYASSIKGIKQDKISDAFQTRIVRQFTIFKELKNIPKDGLTIAIDMHLIPRYDRVPRDELTCSKSKSGTTYFERYMTVQCVNGDMRIVVAASYVKRLESVPDCVDDILKTIAKMGIKIRLVLFDREFFSVETINHLQAMDVKFLMPCKNTHNVIVALREFAEKKRKAASKNMIKNNLNSVTYDMIITNRKKVKDADKPEEKYIGFTTNHPTIKTSTYAKRWVDRDGICQN